MQKLTLEQSIKIGQTCACHHLRRTARGVTRIYEQELRDTGLSANQFSMMIAVRIMEPVPLNQLAESMLMDRTTISRNIKPLKSKGLIQIDPGNDKRERQVSLTEKGHTVLAKAYPLWQNVQKKIGNAIGELQMGSLLSLLQQTANTKI